MDFFGFDLLTLIKTAGYIGLCFIIFAESGLFFGFFFPGDSLLFTAGFLASQGIFTLFGLLFLLIPASILGVQIGYVFGKHIGPKIFTKDDSLFFHKAHIERARLFYEEHGGKALILGRFLPIIRTFVPIVAGVGHMRSSSLFFYNSVGGILWVGGLLLLGFYLGRVVPNIDRYLLPIVLAIIIASLAPTFIQVIRHRRNTKK